jgi:WD40 repeat protein
VPYRGIDPFRYIDHAIFFARAEETHRLTSLVSVYRGVMLYGDSGAGKSSLINAGLIPEAIELGFQAERLRVQPRAGEEIVVERIVEADDEPGLLPTVLAPEETTARAVVSVEEFLARVTAACDGHRLLLIFDQFEELVTLFDEAGSSRPRRKVIELLTGLLRGPLPVKILLSFREDYLGRVKELLADCPELVDQALRLVPPAAAALPMIIRGPFERYPGHFARELSPALAGQLVAALARRFGSGEISLSEVQTVCLRLWQSENPEALLAEKGPQGLLEDYLGDALAGLPAHLRPAAIAVLGQMVTSAGTRNVISAEDLVQRVRDQGSDIPTALLEDALERLSRSRLVRRERRRELYLYEITSEFLVPWISHRRDELRQQQARRRDRRRLLILSAIASVLLIVVAAVTLLAAWAISQRGHARDEATTASKTGRSLGLANAEARLGSRLDVGLLLSLEAIKPYHASPLAAAGARSAMITALEALEPATQSGAVGILHGHTDAVYAVAYSPDGRTVATGSADRTIRLWDVVSHKQIGQPFNGALDIVRTLAFSPDGRTLAAGSDDDSIRLWSVATHKQAGRPLTGHSEVLRSVAFSPDGRTLASGSDDDTIRLWDVASHKQLGKPLRGNRGGVVSVAFAKSGDVLASGSSDHTVRFWDVATHAQLGRPIVVAAGVEAVAFSPDGTTLASGDDDGWVRLWSPSTRGQVGRLFSNDTVYAIAFSHDGTRLVSGGSDDTVKLWSIATRKRLAALTGHIGTVYGVAFSPDGHTVASASDDGTAMLWNVSHPAPRVSLIGHSDNVNQIAFSRDGRTLASASADRTIRLWDVATRRQLGNPLTGHKGGVNSVAFSPDGRTLATGSDDETIRLWDVATHEELGKPLTGHTDAVKSVAFSPDGRILATGALDKTVRLWDVATREPLGKPLTGTAAPVEAVAFSPKGHTLASAGDDDTVRLWDVANRRQLGAPLAGHTGFVHTVAFSPDGRTLASGGGDNTIRLWNVATHRQLGAPLTGHTGGVYGVAFSPDGRTLASAGDDNSVRLWDVATHAQLGLPLPFPDTVFTVAFSPDGRIGAAGGADKTVSVSTGLSWNDFDQLKDRVCALVGTGLSRAEWARYAPGISYAPSCG